MLSRARRVVALSAHVNVIALTVFIGLVLVTFFVLFFLHQTSRRSCSERDSLMPLQEESFRAVARSIKPAKPATPAPSTT